MLYARLSMPYRFIAAVVGVFALLVATTAVVRVLALGDAGERECVLTLTYDLNYSGRYAKKLYDVRRGVQWQYPHASHVPMEQRAVSPTGRYIAYLLPESMNSPHYMLIREDTTTHQTAVILPKAGTAPIYIFGNPELLWLSWSSDERYLMIIEVSGYRTRVSDEDIVTIRVYSRDGEPVKEFTGVTWEVLTWLNGRDGYAKLIFQVEGKGLFFWEPVNDKLSLFPLPTYQYLTRLGSAGPSDVLTLVSYERNRSMYTPEARELLLVSADQEVFLRRSLPAPAQLNSDLPRTYWSPDAKYLVVYGSIYAFDGDQLTFVTAYDGNHIQWSVDDQVVLYVTRSNELWAYRLDKRRHQRLMSGIERSALYFQLNRRWLIVEHAVENVRSMSLLDIATQQSAVLFNTRGFLPLEASFWNDEIAVLIKRELPLVSVVLANTTTGQAYLYAVQTKATSVELLTVLENRPVLVFSYPTATTVEVLDMVTGHREQLLIGEKSHEIQQLKWEKTFRAMALRWRDAQSQRWYTDIFLTGRRKHHFQVPELLHNTFLSPDGSKIVIGRTIQSGTQPVLALDLIDPETRVQTPLVSNMHRVEHVEWLSNQQILIRADTANRGVLSYIFDDDGTLRATIDDANEISDSIPKLIPCARGTDPMLLLED